MSTLSREQVEYLIPHLTALAPTWKREIQQWLDTDAALRAQVTRLTAEVVALKAERESQP